MISIALFTIVSLLSFSVWAFGSQLFGSEPAMYAACAVVFLGGGGLALLPAAGAKGREAVRFCLVFALAYLAYAFLWSLAWFTFPGPFGETIGSAAGLLAFAATMRKGTALGGGILVGTALLFLYHSVGYAAGGFLYQVLQGRGRWGIETGWSPETVRHLARLSWGLCYGLGVGAGIVALLHRSRQNRENPSTQI